MTKMCSICFIRWKYIRCVCRFFIMYLSRAEECVIHITNISIFSLMYQVNSSTECWKRIHEIFYHTKIQYENMIYCFHKTTVKSLRHLFNKWIRIYNKNWFHMRHCIKCHGVYALNVWWLNRRQRIQCKKTGKKHDYTE